MENVLTMVMNMRLTHERLPYSPINITIIKYLYNVAQKDFKSRVENTAKPLLTLFSEIMKLLLFAQFLSSTRCSINLFGQVVFQIHCTAPPPPHFGVDFVCSFLFQYHKYNTSLASFRSKSIILYKK